MRVVMMTVGCAAALAVSCGGLVIQSPRPPGPGGNATVDGDRIGGWSIRDAAGERGGFEPDRRPVVQIPAFTGAESSRRRLDGWWESSKDTRNRQGLGREGGGRGGPNGLADGVDNLLRRLDILYERGFRRFSIKLPAGDPDIDIVKGRKMSSAQWWTMEGWMRDGFAGPIRGWVEEKKRAGDPVKLGVYMGYHVADPTLLSMENARIFDDTTVLTDAGGASGSASAPADMVRDFRLLIDPWLQSGVTEFWFDNSSPANLWPAMLWLTSDPYFQGRAHFGGEAIPARLIPCEFPVIQEAVRRGAWVATFEVAEHRHPTATFDPGATELHLWMSGHYGQRCGSREAARAWNFGDLERFHANGWVLDPEFTFGSADASRGAEATFHYYSRHRGGAVIRNDGGGSGFLPGVEAVQRIYDMGWITCVADFNGDGRIEVDVVGRGGRDEDLRLFEERWNKNRSTSPAVHRFIDGDVNNDGRIEQEDRAFFLRAVQHYRDFARTREGPHVVYTPGPGCSVDLGAADETVLNAGENGRSD